MSVRFDIRPLITLGETQWNESVQKKEAFSIQTNMKSEGLIRNTLTKLYKAKINGKGNVFETVIYGCQLVFQMNGSGFYEVQYFYDVESGDVRALVDDIQAEYKGMVQDYVYNTIKAKAEEKGLVLEQEAVQKNQSIVLTFNLNG
ncbi:hypothetical protein HHL17_27750 [Chitinophaga sp. G-6-1-13]|uniref:DUF1257 domain-containing protein n=1 Tax=Chitinophaga fulva TaxID=2728842 RepID=A0A848GWD1_9BACT|nr:hypothetical protein [Chitinophaga fulva]NML41020.1 hypothetical protein [Chitinophaga fulva]